MRFNLEDYMTTARTVYGEARNQEWEGQLAVAFVILNRVRDGSRWADTPHGVCVAEWQFSAWNDGDPNLRRLAAATLQDAPFRRAFAATAVAFAMDRADPTDGANHYHHRDLDPPSWADADAITARIGDHLFYRL